MKKMKLALFGMLPIAAMLAACGGGSGSSAGGTTTAPVNPTPSVAASTLVTSVPPATYDPASIEYSAFNEINAIRSACGFGLLKQSAELDLAAADHSKYLVLSDDPVNLTHFQNSAYTYFTAVTPQQRGAYRKYPGGVGENILGITTSSKFGPNEAGADFAKVTMSTVYHGDNMIREYVDTGISALHDGFVYTDPTAKTHIVTEDFGDGRNNERQLMAGDAVATYPCDGMREVKPSFYGESPEPFSESDYVMRTEGKYAGILKARGPAIFIKVRDGQMLQVSSFSLTDAQGKNLPGKLMTNVNDPNRLIRVNTVVFSSDAPLKENASYTFRVVGTNAGSSFDKTVHFTTGIDR